MTERVKRLRQQSVETRPYISSERAELLTDFYASGQADTVSVPVARAMALAHLLDHRTICLQPGELLVGERGPAPKATPTYPELCCHTLEDFDVMAARDRTPFDVSDDVRRVYRDRIIPFWQGRTIRERLFAGMTDDWHGAFDAGVFTEFMEQRAFGHAILDDKIYTRGFMDFTRRMAERQEEIDVLTDPRAFEKREELKAMTIAADPSSASRAGTPTSPTGWPTTRPTRPARANSATSPRSAAASRRFRRGRSTRRSRCTGSCTWASSRN